MRRLLNVVMGFGVVFAAAAHAQPPPDAGVPAQAPTAPTTEPVPTEPTPPPVVVPAPPAKPEENIVVKVFGRVQLSAGVDPINQGDVPDFLAPPDAFKREVNVSTMLNAAIGASFVVPKPVGGFTIRGAFGVGVYIRRIFSESQGFIELDHEKQGLKIRAGKMIGPTVSAYFPGSFQYPGFYGNLAYALTGVKVSQTLGPVLAEVAVGRPDFPFIPIEITPTAQANPPLPFVEGRIAYRNPKLMGELPGSALGPPIKTPLTIGVSGAYGQMRVGPGEKAAVIAVSPMAVDPKTEDLNSYLISAEIVVPIQQFVLLSEFYAGRGTNLYLGGFRQRPRVDPMTGSHKVLGTGGGYVQLSYAPQPAWIILALAGIDKVVSGLGHGVAVEPTPRIEQNRILLASVSRTFGPGLKVGLQAHHLKTEYRDLGDGSMFGVIADIVIGF